MALGALSRLFGVRFLEGLIAIETGKWKKKGLNVLFFGECAVMLEAAHFLKPSNEKAKPTAEGGSA